MFKEKIKEFASNIADFFKPKAQENKEQNPDKMDCFLLPLYSVVTTGITTSDIAPADAYYDGYVRGYNRDARYNP